MKGKVKVMMYAEFIEKTGFDESYMTYDDYTDFIEPVYMSNADDKGTFCKKFYLLHRNNVSAAVELMIKGKSLEEKEAYICGESSTFDDITKANALIKKGFLIKLKELYK